MASFVCPEPDRLDRLVTVLDASCREGGWHQPHRMVFMAGETLGTRVLEDGSHPLDHLLGFTAPDSWEALGLVCMGWAAPASPSATRPSRHPARQRVRVVTVVDRSGAERATVGMEDGTVLDDPGEGVVLDALRRALGLATPPPPVPLATFLDDLWLRELASSPRRLTWTEAAALRPAPVGTWSVLRACGWPGVDADLASWMDDGMFARWVAGTVPPRTELLEELAARQTAAVARRVRLALARSALD